MSFASLLSGFLISKIGNGMYPFDDLEFVRLDDIFPC